MSRFNDQKATYRPRRVINPNNASKGFSDPTPAFTYGRPVKPLPLKGTHFRQSDPYDIPPESDEEKSAPPRKPAKRVIRQPDPNDSPLSEDELEAVYGGNASPSQSSSPDVPTSSRKTIVEVSARRNTSRQVKDVQAAGTLNKPSRSSIQRDEAGAVRKIAKPAHHATRQNKSKQSQKYKSVSKPPPKRLPVDELVLVMEQAGGDDHHEPLSSPQLEQTQDPIADTSSPNRQRLESTLGDASSPEDKDPLTTIRRRLKTPKFTHKSIVALRKKKSEHSNNHQRIGDGFELSELRINHSLDISRKRKTNKSLVAGFGALNLKAGPLPEVKFEDSSCVLKMERSDEGQDVSFENGEGVVETTEQDSKQIASSPRQSVRRVGFSDRVLDEMVMKQLSSISAPRRVYSISSDDSEKDQDDFEETDEESEEEEDRSAETIENDDDPDQSSSEQEQHASEPKRRRLEPTLPSNQRARQNSSFWRRRSSPVTPAPVRNAGVSLDFRRPGPEGLAKAPTPFGKRNLMEVDDNIYDEPERPSLPPFDSGYNADGEMLDEPFPAPPPRPRPRSILRSHTPLYQSTSTTRPSDTAANTRRNSTIMLFDEDDEEQRESRYFTSATSLRHRQHQHTTKPKPLITKHRSSELRRSRSGYFDHPPPQKEIQVPDSETLIPETSSPRPDYTNFTNLDVLLKRSSDAIWTSSQSLPRAERERDLKTLTRTVSRGFGTVGRRRRPSLPFRSPVKGRRG